MSEAKRAGQKASLSEQRSSSGTEAEKETVGTLEGRTGDTRGLERRRLPPKGDNPCVPSSIRVEAGQHCEGEQKGLFKRCEQQKENER